MKYSIFTTIAALATTALAGTMTWAAVLDNTTPSIQRLNPEMRRLIEQVEAGDFDINAPLNLSKLKPRVLNRAKKPSLGIQRDNTRLQVKFSDNLQIRLQADGVPYSRTNRSIDSISALIADFNLTFTPCINADSDRVDALIATAEQRSNKQAPDIGGMFWIDGSRSAVATAAGILHRMNEVEWVFWNTVFDPTKHTSDRPSIFSAQSKQAADRILAANNQVVIPTGACLLNDRTCEPNVSADVCRALGGTYLGNASICEQTGGDGLERGGGACCFILLTGPPTGALGVFACMDTTNDVGFTQADCEVIGPDPFSKIYVADIHSNGVWFPTEECDGITTDCVLGPGGGPPGAFICGDSSDTATMFSGDCYHDQSDPDIDWANRIPSAFIPAATFAPGCFDSAGFATTAPTNAVFIQLCCDAVALIDPSCTDSLWDAACANYANASTFSLSCFNQTDLTGVSGDCSSPWGPNHRPYPVTMGGPRGVQRMLAIASDGTITNHVDPISGDPYGCGGVGAFPGQPTFAPIAGLTSDFLTLGLLPHLTDETLDLASITDQALLQWPMGGVTVGSVADSSTFDVPVISARGDSRWSGTGLNLFADQSSPTGIGHGDKYSGLYGLGFRRAEETGFADGTHGAGVRVAVLDYAAYIQSYTDTTGTVVGGVHEDLTSILLEGTSTGHASLQMVFNPPDAPDFPFDFAQSPNHGTAQLGVIAASWNGTIPADGTLPLSNIGAMGIVPEATVAFFPLLDLESLSEGTGGRVETAWFNAMEWLRFGDVLSAGYVGLDNFADFPNISFNPANHTLLEVANGLGISVVIPAGDNGTDLAAFTFPNAIDPGAIVATAVTPGGSPAKRWADSVSGSNFVEAGIDTARNTCAAWGAGVTTCGMGPGQDNWLGYKTIVYTDAADPVEVAARSYTNNYSGTSAASAIVAANLAAIQGYARQVFRTPLGPLFARHYIAHGQILGNDPTTGDPILSTLTAAATDTNVAQGTENDMEFGEWPDGAALYWDVGPVAGGAGNITGYFADARWACIRMTVDPIFDNPNVDTLIVLRGDWLEGTKISVATQDEVFLGVNSVNTPVGDYGLPATVPGDFVTYLFAGETTDIYITGVATDPRGNPLLSLHNMSIDVALAPTQAPTTMLQLWMWDFQLGRWIQPSVTGALVAGTTDYTFELIRPLNLLNADGRYHARFVSITGFGPMFNYPIYYDQIRVIPTIPSTNP